MANISAARLNNLQARVELILGNGAGESGYGQDGTDGYGAPVSSFPVDKTTDLVEAEHINNIYADILRTKIHQAGPSDPAIRQVVENLTVVAEETAYNVGADGSVAADPEGVFKGIADYERIMDTVEVDKFLIHPTQGTLRQATNSVRTNPWNGLIFHEVTVTFRNADHRRHFFNTGGELRFAANNSNAVLGKGLDWSTLLRDIGTIVFNHNSTVSTGDGNGTAIGNYDLTAAFQTTYEKVGSGTYSNIYAGNIYQIKARAQSDSVIVFRIEFYDIVVDNSVDNNVDGRLESVVQEYRSTGDVVTVPAPVYFNSTTLSVFGTPTVDEPSVYQPVDDEPTVPPTPPSPTYSITMTNPVTNVIPEGTSGTYTVNTTNVPNGTRLYWTITNLTTSGLDFTATSGSFTINSNTGSFSVGAAADALVEGQESFTVRIRTVSATGPIVASVSTTIGDTLPPPAATYSITPNAALIRQGENNPVTFTVTTTNVPDGTRLYTLYDNGVQDPVSSNFLISGGVGTFTISGTDFWVNPSSYIIYVRTFNSISGTTVATANLVVASAPSVPQPTYSLSPSNPSVDLGATVTYTLTTTNVPDGTTFLYGTFQGSGTYGTQTGFVTVNSGSGTFTIDTSAFVAGLYDINVLSQGVTLASSRLTVVSDAPPPQEIPTYSIAITNPISNVIPEGSSGIYTVTTTNVPNGTTLYWTIVDQLTNISDFTSRSGSFTINSNTGTFNISTVADQLTEGQESFVVRVRTGSISGPIVASTSTTIGDTSRSPTYSISITNPVSNVIPEGTTGTYALTTSNVPNGTVFYWTIANLTTNNADFTATSGSFTVNSSVGIFSIGAVADQLTEGQQSFTVQIRTGSISGPIVASVSTTIGDTSLSPTYNMTVNSGRPNFPTVGDETTYRVFTYTVTTTNVPNGTVLYWNNVSSFAGASATADDFVDALTGTVTINNNTGTFTRTARTDNFTDGNSEFFGTELRTGSTTGPVVRSAIFAAIQDTSQTPTYSIATVSSHPTLTSVISEGQYIVSYIITTTNVPNGTVLYWTIVGNSGSITAADFTDNTLTGTVTINNNSATVIRSARADSLTEGPEVFTLQLRTGSTSGTVVAFGRPIGIADTSTTPT